MIAQSIANTLVAASPVVLVSIGLSLIYACTRTLHFAHGAVLSCAPFVVYVLHRNLGYPLMLCLGVGCLATCGIAIMLDLLIYRPMRRRNASPLAILLASLGIAVVLQNGLSLAFGDNVTSWRAGSSAKILAVFGARLTLPQVMGLCATVSLSVAVLAVIALTRAGKHFRAISCGEGLAEAVGIDVHRIVLMAYGLAGLLAGVAGLILAADVDMTPGMGAPILMIGLVAFVLGGARSVCGAVVGAIILICMRQMVGLWLGTKWMDGLVFAILLVVLLVNPSGMTGGTKERSA